MSLEEVKKATFEKRTEINVDKPQVRVFEMQVAAIQQLATDQNEIFSEISKPESINLTICSLFGRNPCPNINERLQKKGIQYFVELPVLDEYITEVLRHRHKMNRKRVDEYLHALDTLKSEQSIRMMDERPPIMRRLI